MESSLPLPYDIVEESDWNYSFKTKHGIVYHAYFIDFSIYHPTFDNVYTFNIEPESDRAHSIDNRIAMTIVSLLRIFFSRNDHAMIMVCDNLDGKEKKRRLLFSKWYSVYNDGSIIKYDASTQIDDYLLYVSIYLNKGNYILFCTISKTIKGHMIMYPFIILYNSAMITFSQKVDL